MAVNLTKLTNLKSIGQGAFLNCSSIDEVIGSDLKKLQYINGGTNNFGANATFSGCTSLKNVDFHGCTAMTRLGGSGTAGVFINCTALETVDFSGCTSLTRIWYYAFAGCTGMKTINFADSPLNQIMEGTFKNCKATNWYLKLDNVTGIDSEAFNGSGNADTIPIDFVLPKFSWWNWAAFANSYVPKSFDVHGSTISKFYSQDFTGCKNLESVDFSGCTNLTSVYKNTGDWGAFENCSKLTSANFNGCTSLNCLGRNAFRNCQVLTSVDFTNCPVDTIQEFCFQNDCLLEDFDLSSGSIKSIGTRAFEYCLSMTNFTLKFSETETAELATHCMAGWRNVHETSSPKPWDYDFLYERNNPVYVTFLGGNGTLPTRGSMNIVNGLNYVDDETRQKYFAPVLTLPTSWRTLIESDTSYTNTDYGIENASFWPQRVAWSLGGGASVTINYV